MEGYEIDFETLELLHYGIKYKSGRYPYGSGEDPYQHDGGIRGYVRDMKGQGVTEVDIAKNLHMTTTELRMRQQLEKMEKRNESVAKVMELTDKGLNNSEIGRELGIPESSVRSLKNAAINDRNNIAKSTAKMLKSEVDQHGITSAAGGMENRLKISKNKLEAALILLEREGYSVHKIPVKQVGTGHTTTVRVIAPPGQEWKETLKQVKEGNIHVIADPYSDDGGRTWQHLEPPRSISSSRVMVRYGDEGGTDKDGLIEIRPGVEDLDMGRNQYAQVRIAVDGTHYMKGMAIYNPNLPKGVDIIYNSKKPKNTSLKGEEYMNKYFKPLKDDPDNVFGSKIKDNEYNDEGQLVREVGQRHYIDKNGKKQLSTINIINEEGDWGNWKKRLSSQMLSKQTPELAKKQLTLAYEKKVREFEDIKALTNTAIQHKLLQSFSDDCDSSAVHLKAAALPGQQSHVIIPFPELKPNEIYAPNYKNGEIVSLIRYPHEGIFQIPTLRVNNNVKAAKDLLGNARDAVGINHEVAVQLSGADFDGDSVLVIPNPNGKLIQSRPVFDELKDFDTDIYSREMFPPDKRNWIPPKEDKGFNQQMQMGSVSNLITDMTLKGAKDDELVRAVKHSMVIIDSEKHDLNWKQSAKDNGIAELKTKYQGGPNRGSSTLISKAKSKAYVNQRADFYENMIDKETGEIHWRDKLQKKVDPETGEVTYQPIYKRKKDPKTGEYYDSTERKQTETTKMMRALEETGDARTLSSGTIMEDVYADYANKVHSLANEARKYMVNLKNMEYNKSAKEAYKTEVASILDKIDDAMKNRPLEQKAQVLAGSKLSMWKKDNPDADFADIKKHGGLFLAEARQRMGSAKHRIKLTPKEWEAIQAGAITHTMFLKVLNNTDLDAIKDYATPRNYTSKLGKSELAYAKSLLAGDRYTTAEVAALLGVSVSTLYKALE